MTALHSIQGFWEWFSQNASKFGDTFDNHPLLRQLDAHVGSLGDFGWEVGPGQQESNAFVLSPGGDRDLLAETTAIIAAAPKLKGWEDNIQHVHPTRFLSISE